MSRTAILLLASVMGAFAAPDYPAPPFLPPAGHPRVYFTPRDLPRLLANREKQQNAAAWQAHLRNLEKVTDGVLPKAAPDEANFDSNLLVLVESYAFDYALRGNQANGRRAVTAMRNYIRTLAPVLDYNFAGQTIFTIAIVYDWCYPLLTAADRDAFYRAVTAAAEHLEVGWPPVKQGNVVGHGPEGQILRDLMCAGVAMYDEHPEVYRMVAGRFFSRMVENKKFMYPGNSHSQGSHYVTYRGQWEMLATWIFDRMGLPKVFGPDQQYFMYWSLYARRPDGQMLRDGDTHINNIAPGTYYTQPARTLFLAGNYFGDQYLKQEALREMPDFAPGRSARNQSLNPVEILIFNNPDLQPRPLDELPLTHYFPSTKGAMIARSGWQEGVNSPAVVAEMKIDEWSFGNHQHLDAGAFQIYYRGTLANDSGYYQAAVNQVGSLANDGNSGYGSVHDFNYNKRTIAHNTMVVFDPNERFELSRAKVRVLSNDGGQRMPHEWVEPKEHAELLDPANGFRTGEVLGRGFGPDAKAPEYTYLKGDLAKAYSAKIKAFERSFVFLNLRQAEHPAALLVFDRVVSSNAAFRKAWVLHGLERPEVAGNRAVFKNTRPGYTGKLTVDTLLPEAVEISTVGGPGNEAWVDGVNYPALTRNSGNNEGHGWRIEVSPKGARETDYFLNVLQVGDHTPDAPALAVERIDAETHAGARLADRVVLFGKTRERTASAVSFRFSGGRARILVADLQAGAWTVEHDGKAAGAVTVSADEGVAYFQGDGGGYRLVAR